MSKINKSIEIVASSVGQLNSMTHTSRAAIQAILSRHYEHVVVTIINTMDDLEALALRTPDLVFLGMKCVPGAAGDTIWLSEYLDNKGITSTGSNHRAIRLERDKKLAKQRITDFGLQTPRFQVLIKDAVFTAADIQLNYPVFIKPPNRGGGAGVDDGSLAYNFIELQAKVQSLSSVLQSDALVEEYLPGREFSVGIIKHLDSDDYHTMPLELIAPAREDGARFLSGRVKSADTETHTAVTDTVLKAQISQLGLQAFHALGARDYGRIDIRLDANGTPHFLEANLLPSLLANYGNFPKACMLNIKLRHEDAILQIVDLAFQRASTRHKLFHSIAIKPLLQLPPAFPGIAFEPIL
jgi:D-alanine-D-alanine ligase